MRSSFLLITVFIFSCRSSSKLPDKNLILDVLNNYIKEDSLYKENISSNLLPYLYYPTRYSDDGYEIPPPSISFNGEYLDENKIMERVEKIGHIAKFDAEHVKKQLLKSKYISFFSKGMKLTSTINENEKMDRNLGYILYVPIFNIDSSAVYVQYDFYINYSNGGGSGAVLVKQKGKWQMVKWLDRWTN